MSALSQLDIDHDAFYICTETSPRCFVVQKAIQIDRNQIERLVGEDFEKLKDAPRFSSAREVAPPAPQMPYWFTPQCRQELVNCDGSSTVPAAPSPRPLSRASPAPSPSPSPCPPVDVRAQLKAQLEYYFSRENLITDRYLRCQMDADQYVAISIIAGFRKVVQLTSDYSLILQVLRESDKVEVDESGERVRPVNRRCTIILREIDEKCKKDVEKILGGGPPYISLTYSINKSWYVTYSSEDKTQQAYLHIQGCTFQDKPIMARIKCGGPPCPNDERRQSQPEIQIPTPVPPVPQTRPLLSQNIPPPSLAPLVTPPTAHSPSTAMFMFDLGRILGEYGYVPRATYRPGSMAVLVQDRAKTAAPRNSLSPRPQRQERYGREREPRENGYPRAERRATMGGLRSGRGRGGGGGGGCASSAAAAARAACQYQQQVQQHVQQLVQQQQAAQVAAAAAVAAIPPLSSVQPAHREGGWRRHTAPSSYDTVNGRGGQRRRGEPREAREGYRRAYNGARKDENGHAYKEERGGSYHGRKRWDTTSTGDDDADGSDVERKTSASSHTSSYSFEERAFPQLVTRPPTPPPPRPPPPPPKPSFSSVAAGRKDKPKQEPKKRSYAQTLAQL